MTKAEFELWIAGSKVADKNIGITTYVPPKQKEPEKKRKVSRPKGRHLLAEGRQAFCEMCKERGLPVPVPEYKPFVNTLKRKHSVDFYFEHDGLRMALEVEGWGHKTNSRYTEDMFKYNQLAIHRIYPMRVKPKQLYTEHTFSLIKDFFKL